MIKSDKSKFKYSLKSINLEDDCTVENVLEIFLKIEIFNL